MTPEVVEKVILGVAGTFGVTSLGGIIWGVQRIISKVDGIDRMIRGNGKERGIREQINDLDDKVEAHIKDTRMHPHLSIE